MYRKRDLKTSARMDFYPAVGPAKDNSRFEFRRHSASDVRLVGRDRRCFIPTRVSIETKAADSHAGPSPRLGRREASRVRSPVSRPLRVVRTISRLPSAAENYSNLRMEGLTRLQEHRLELQHRLDMHRSQMEMPPSPSPSSRSLAPFSSASSSLSEGSNQPSGEDSASIVTGTLFFFSLYSSLPPPLRPHTLRW